MRPCGSAAALYPNKGAAASRKIAVGIQDTARKVAPLSQQSAHLRAPRDLLPTCAECR
jgi:hypothetical protein